MPRLFYDFRTPLVDTTVGIVTLQWQDWLNTIFAAISSLQQQMAQVFGVHYGALGTEPTGLTPADVGYLFTVDTPYYHTVRWNGTGWDWFDGDRPGRFEYFAQAPGAGWQLCDGSAITLLTVGATLGSAAFTAPNVGAGRILKTAAAYTGTNEAAVAPGVGNADPPDTAASSNVNFIAYAGGGSILDYNLQNHVHTHNHVHAVDATSFPPSLGALLYVRR